MSQTSGWPSISMGSASMGSTHCESKLIFKYYRKFQKAKLEFATQGDGTPLQYSCLENPMGGGAWWAAVRGVAKSLTRLSKFTFTFHFHASEKEMATHSSVLAGEPQGRGTWWAAFYGVAQSGTRLKRRSSSSTNAFSFPITKAELS